MEDAHLDGLLLRPGGDRVREEGKSQYPAESRDEASVQHVRQHGGPFWCDCAVSAGSRWRAPSQNHARTGWGQLRRGRIDPMSAAEQFRNLGSPRICTNTTDV